MKYLQDYMNERQTNALNRAGAFFAFSNKQFDEQKKPNIVYTTVEASSPEEAVRLIEEDEDSIQSIDWKEDYDEHDGWNYTAEEVITNNN
jgi:hypothetical protein